jgi:fumarate hydratase subunit beta
MTGDNPCTAIQFASWTGAKEVKMPLNVEELVEIRNIRAGDKVLLYGTMYTARDAAHKRIVASLAEGKTLPFELEGQVIYYAGPCPPAPGKVIGSLGPTTSGRMDPYAPALIAAGLRGMIGKGQRTREVKDAIVKFGAVYFVAVGGAGALLSRTVTEAQVVAYPELGPEAVYRLRVEGFPVVVGIDVRGNDVYDREVAG